MVPPVTVAEVEPWAVPAIQLMVVPTVAVWATAMMFPSKL
jgi:hypothetical protein